MEFIGKTYHFLNKKHGHSFKICVEKKGDVYVSKSQFVHPKSGEERVFETPVTISSSMFVESPAINVKKHFNKAGVDDSEWKINDRAVDEIKVKCKFKGTKMSYISTILVRHTGMEKWVSYPFSMIGELIVED